jgi:FAD/FMN-containing dehydrogenase
MMNTNPTNLAALENFLLNHPHIPYVTPASSNYASLREIFQNDRKDTPLAIVRPQSATDVSLLVNYAKSQGVKFTIRSGGHDLQGRSISEGTLTFDMRDIAFVNLASDGQSATIGGGVLLGELAQQLWKEGLATPMGTIPAVGYVGWATYGGYGPFSGRWGLGVDQLIGAKLVNANGEIVEADQSMLKGIRGAGGVFGIIVEVTIKVYPLKSVGLLFLSRFFFPC